MPLLKKKSSIPVAPPPPPLPSTPAKPKPKATNETNDSSEQPLKKSENKPPLLPKPTLPLKPTAAAENEQQAEELKQNGHIECDDGSGTNSTTSVVEDTSSTEDVGKLATEKLDVDDESPKEKPESNADLKSDSATDTLKTVKEHSESENAEKSSGKKGKDKPKPPGKSRLKRALTSGSLTLQRLSTKSLKKKESRRISMNLEDEPVVEGDSTKGNELRDAGLWKLPGMEIASKKEQNSPLTVQKTKEKTTSSKVTEDSSLKTEEAKIKRKTSFAKADEGTVAKNTLLQSKTSQELEAELKNRMLPPLPTADEVTIPPVAKTTPQQSRTSQEIELELKSRELPPIPTEEDQQAGTTAQDHVVPATSTPPSLRKMEEFTQTPEKRTSKDHLNESITSSREDNETPPPLPARTYAQTPEGSRKTSEIVPPDSTLKGVLKKFQGCYPLRFRVLQGYCNDASDINMSTDDVYDIHLVKETKVVSVRSDNGTLHRIPLGSPQKVAIIYNPSNDYEKGLEGYIFKSIAEITSATTLPKVICATQEARATDGKYLVEENEVLVVRNVHRTLFKGKKGLKVVSMMTKTEKVLPEDCFGYFTTKPSLVRLHLPEIIGFVPKLFPVSAVMYSAGESTVNQEQPGTITGVVTIVESTTETSLVVSAAPFDENLELIPMDQVDFSTSELFDIPVDEEMRQLEVAVVQASAKPDLDQSDDHTYDDTINIGNLGNDIDTASMSDESDHTYDDTVNVMRSQDFIVNSSGQLNESQNLLHSAAFADLGRTEEKANGFAEEDEMAGYDTVGLHLLNQSQPRQNKYHYSNDSYDDVFRGEDPRITSWMEDLQSATSGLEQRMMSLESNKNTAEMTKMQDMLLQLTKKLESVDTQLQTFSTQPPSDQDQSEAIADKVGGAKEEVDGRSPEEINQQYLASLSVEQVCALFDAMSLGQYKEHLTREMVTGDILIEFDDEVLKDELEIKSKIQRIRLMKVINGQHSAKDLLEK